MMKTTWLALILMGCMACNPSGSSSEGKGDEGAGGGAIEVQDVQLMVDDVLSKVRAMPEVFPEVDASRLEDVARKVEIVGKEKTYANGVETDAANNGSTRIELNMSRWKRLRNHNKKSALIFHELLGIMGLEKNNYAISSRLLVEHRFGPDREYTCRPSPNPAGQTCKISMGHDPTQDGFQVEDEDCGSFPAERPVLYRPYLQAFSANGYCPEDFTRDAEPPPEQKTCMNASSDGLTWTALQFRTGYQFQFTGKRGSVLNCNLE